MWAGNAIESVSQTNPDSKHVSTENLFCFWEQKYGKSSLAPLINERRP